MVNFSDEFLITQQYMNIFFLIKKSCNIADEPKSPLKPHPHLRLILLLCRRAEGQKCVIASHGQQDHSKHWVSRLKRPYGNAPDACSPVL